MSSPSFENIDQWFFEYTEGNLGPEQEAQFHEFMAAHPEMQSELDLWEKVKVTPSPSVPSGLTSLSLQSKPILLHPISLTGIGMTTLLLGWFLFTLWPESTTYSMEDIDAEIILAENSISQNNSSYHQLIKGKKNTPPTTQKERSAFILNASTNKMEETEVKTNNLTAKLNYDHPIISPTPTTDLTADKRGGKERKKITGSKNQSSPPSLFSIIKNKKHTQNSKAEDLPQIIAYLNNSRKDNPIKNYQKGETELASYSKTDVNTSKESTFKKSFESYLSSIFRSIGRMANHPTALRNTNRPHYQVPMMTGFKANAAMVGTAPGNRLQVTSRFQWLGQPNAQLMNTVSWDGYIYALRGGFGIDVNYNNYNANELNNYSVGLTYSPKFSITPNISIEPAIRFKMGVINITQEQEVIENKIELKRHHVVSMFTKQEKTMGSQLWYRDIGAAIMINTKWFYAGIDIDNLGRHNNNFYSDNLDKDYKSNLFYTAVIGTEYQPIRRNFSVSGYALYQNYGPLNELWVGGNFKYKFFQVGAGISSNLDYGGSMGLVFSPFSIQYNLDYTKSYLLNQRFLSHQLTMQILIQPNRTVARYLNL